MKISLNREYALRHLFAVLVVLGLAGWFGYDGFVRYPRTDAAALYAAIEGAAPPEGTPPAKLEAFKAQKTGFQRMAALVLLLAGAVVGLRLLASARFRLDFDEAGFTFRGRRYSYADVKALDDRDWGARGIARASLAGRRIVLDAWHHVGVKEFYEKLKHPVDSGAEI